MFVRPTCMTATFDELQFLQNHSSLLTNHHLLLAFTCSSTTLPYQSHSPPPFSSVPELLSTFYSTSQTTPSSSPSISLSLPAHLPPLPHHSHIVIRNRRSFQI